MINWTEEDVRFICENIMTPIVEEIAQTLEKKDEMHAKSLEHLTNIIIEQIKQIRYEQERDRRFYKAMFTQVFEKNETAYNDFYQTWCEEYDKLNKEKKR